MVIMNLQNNPVEQPHGKLDETIVATVRTRLPQARAIYRYGSAGGIYERPDSDLDVAILGTAPLGFEEILALSSALAMVAGRDVDVVDMRAIPVTLRLQIVVNGTRLFAQDESEAAELESRTFSDYARLNEERRAILEDVRAHGSIYG